jgi:hypothetical protein
MIPNLHEVRFHVARGCREFFCNVWVPTNNPGGRERFIGEAHFLRDFADISMISPHPLSYRVGYRLRIRVKPGAIQ